MIVGLMIFSSQLPISTTTTTVTSETIDMELEDREIKQELESIGTEEIG